LLCGGLWCFGCVWGCFLCLVGGLVGGWFCFGCCGVGAAGVGGCACGGWGVRVCGVGWVCFWVWLVCVGVLLLDFVVWCFGLCLGLWWVCCGCGCG
ncbi:hypothetical protein RA268_27680, partial [Pseudomonas syringae pv. tagetis]